MGLMDVERWIHVVDGVRCREIKLAIGVAIIMVMDVNEEMVICSCDSLERPQGKAPSRT